MIKMKALHLGYYPYDWKICRVRWKQVQAAKKIIDKSCFRWYEETDKALPNALTGNKLDCRLFLAAIKARREEQRAYWEEVWEVLNLKEAKNEMVNG